MKCTLGVGHIAAQAAAVDLFCKVHLLWQVSSKISHVIETALNPPLNNTCSTTSCGLHLLQNLSPIALPHLGRPLPAAIVFQLRMNPGGGRVGRTNKTDTDSAAPRRRRRTMKLHCHYHYPSRRVPGSTPYKVGREALVRESLHCF